jgi:hypothetical protein
MDALNATFASDLPGDFDPEQKKEVGYVILFWFLKSTVEPITCRFSFFLTKPVDIANYFNDYFTNKVHLERY